MKIEDDLTKKEREIQEKLRDIAREEREKSDDKMRIGYKKIFLKQKWHWCYLDEREDRKSCRKEKTEERTDAKKD